jgi:hypothetical protein
MTSPITYGVMIDGLIGAKLSSSMSSPITSAVPAGTSRHNPGRSASGSDTTARAPSLKWVAEGMAVRLLHRGARTRAHVRQKQTTANFACQLEQVLVRARRLNRGTGQRSLRGNTTVGGGRLQRDHGVWYLPGRIQSVTMLLFTEGKAFTTLEFDSAPSDPVPPEFVTDVGQKQDAAIKSGLPG